MIPDKSKEAAAAIGQYYLTKNNGDYDYAAREIESLRITGVDVDDDGIITINTARPGLVIGIRGLNIDALTKFLNGKVRIVEVQEDILEYLIPRPPETDMWDGINDDMWDSINNDGDDDGDERTLDAV